jgi:hypothetical protein
MPFIDQIPTGWIKLQISGCLIEILHFTLVVDISQNTSLTFETIHKKAQQEFDRLFGDSKAHLPAITQLNRQ